MTIRPHIKNSGENGSVLFMILIAVALFGALGFAVSNMMRGGPTDIGKETSALRADEIIEYGRKMREAVQAMRISNDCRDTEISFENSVVAGYNFATRDECKIFNPAGGGMTYIEPAVNWMDSTWSAEAGYQEWFLTGQGDTSLLGTATAHQLTLVLPFVTQNTCLTLNEKLGNGSAIPQENDGPGNITFKFTGSYPDTGAVGYEIGSLVGKMAGCVEGENNFANTFPAGSYHFFQVLIVR